MRRYFFSLSAVFTTLCFSSQVFSQTAEVSYEIEIVPVPVFGTGMAFLLGILLVITAVVWMRRHPNSSFRHLAVSAMGLGLLASIGSGAWLVGNAEAVLPPATTYSLHENPSPVLVTEFPAELENDLHLTATLTAIDVSGCPGDVDVTGTCEVGSVLSGNLGSCSLDSVCDFVPGVCGNGQLDDGEEFDPPPGPFGSAPVLSESCRWDFSSVSQLYCEGTCSISGGSGCDQTEADRFCKIKTDNPASVATSFSTPTALDEPGFSCANQLGVPVDMNSRGVTEVIRYQDSSIVANHGAGHVITNAVCTDPD